MARDVVIGAGVVGLFAAWELARTGRRVLVLERGRVAGGTTTKSFAWLNGTSKTDPAYHRLNAAGLRRHHELARQWGEHAIGFCGAGAILWSESDAALWADPGAGDGIEALAAYHETLRALDYPAVWLERASLTALESRVAFADQAAGILAPADRWSETGKLAKRVADDITRLGGEICEMSRVTSFDRDSDGRITMVICADASYEADNVVLAAGPETTDLVALIGGPSNPPFPVDRVPGLLITTPPDRVHDLVRYVLHAPDPGGFHVRPTADGGLLLGADDIDETINENAPPEALRAAAGVLMERARRYLPTLPIEDLLPSIDLQIGIRPFPRDERTIAGALPGSPGCYVIATHSGVTLAPLLGELIAEEIVTGSPPNMLKDFRPDRFV